MNNTIEKLSPYEEKVLDRIYDERFLVNQNADRCTLVAGESMEFSFFEHTARTAQQIVIGYNLFVKFILTMIGFIAMAVAVYTLTDFGPTVFIIAVFSICSLFAYDMYASPLKKDPSHLITTTQDSLQIWRGLYLKKIIAFSDIKFIDCRKTRLTPNSFVATMYDRNQKLIASIKIPEKRILVSLGSEIIKKSRAKRLKR